MLSEEDSEFFGNSSELIRGKYSDYAMLPLQFNDDCSLLCLIK